MASLKQFPSSFANSIILPMKLFQFIGLDLLDSEIRLKNRIRLILFLTVFFTFLIGQIAYIATVDDFSAEFLDIADAIPCLILVLQGASKLTLIRKRHLIRQIILDLVEIWPNDDQIKEKKELMEQWLHSLNTFCDIVFKLTVIALIVYTGPQIFIYFLIASRKDKNAAYLYTFRQCYPFKIDSIWKYVVSYVIQAILGAIIHIGIYHSCDLLLVTLTVDVCILLRLLRYDLVNIRVEPGREEEALADLKRIVKTHQKLLRLAQRLNQIYGAIIFTVVTSSSLIICFFGFLAMVVKGGQLLLNVTTALQIMFLVFYITLPGQILTDTSSGVSDAAYECLWYSSDTRFRKIICIIIARSQKPCKLQALGFTDLNFTAFSKICSTAWSYLSLVYQMYQKFEFDL